MNFILKIAVLMLLPATVVFAEDTDAIIDLQKQRAKVCKELEQQDGEGVIKALRQTGDFLEELAEKSDNPERLNRLFKPVHRRLNQIYQAGQIKRHQINTIVNVYQEAIVNLRVLYKNEIRRELRKNPQVGFFENSCERLKTLPIYAEV